MTFPSGDRLRRVRRAWPVPCDVELGGHGLTSGHALISTHAEGPVALFNHAVTWLRRHRVLVPGVSVLARQVSESRTMAERRLFAARPGAVPRSTSPRCGRASIPPGKI
ncbi:DUF4158 domain-containing protein [Nonomuraea sp. NPDC001831]|uniref:DUF4158 domain-containing protein n=1 Tax=Nonomuraea sp. NPDC001831 TaxID=3364340 RepID=UPI0036A2A46D